MCEATSKANLFGYLLFKILGDEFGFSVSGNGAHHLCKTEVCDDPPSFACGGNQCEAARVGISAAVYRGKEIKLCTILKSKLGWVGTQMCKYADVKASVRLGVGVTASAAVEEGKPTGSCEACCANGNSVGSFEAGPQGLLEGKAAASFKLWKLEIEAGIGVKACGSLTGKVGTDCDGNPYAAPVTHGFVSGCIESMVAPGISFRILNNEAHVCIPLGFWDYCFDIHRCWKDGDPALACPSGSPNPE